LSPSCCLITTTKVTCDNQIWIKQNMWHNHLHRVHTNMKKGMPARIFFHLLCRTDQFSFFVANTFTDSTTVQRTDALDRYGFLFYARSIALIFIISAGCTGTQLR
jgi:hypothetical protein